MTRKSFAIRHLRAEPPDEQTARKYLLEWHAGELYHRPEAFPKIASASLFGNELPLELEIGCGTGEFLCSLACAGHTRNFVGFDISLKSLYIAIERARSLSLDNIIFIKAPIHFAYPLLVPGSLQAIYLHFPDPCLRPKYRKRRIFNEIFLDQAHSALVDGGRLSVMTDVAELFTDMLALAREDERFEIAPYRDAPSGFPADTKSRYQSIRERHGAPPLGFEARK